jgi:hypothetical protein
VLNPTYTKEQIDNLDKNEKMVRAYDGTFYLPGLWRRHSLRASECMLKQCIPCAVQSHLELDGKRMSTEPFLSTEGIVGLNNIKANDYCNVILQVSAFPSRHRHSRLSLGSH